MYIYQNRLVIITSLKRLGIIIKWIKWDKIVTWYQKKEISVCWQKVVHSGISYKRYEYYIYNIYTKIAMISSCHDSY